MAKANRAALFFEPGKSFELTELPIPEPAAGGLTLNITRANICGSELHIWRGDGRFSEVVTPRGRILGHEATGVVHALGDGVTTDWAGTPLAEGDRIAYQYFKPCGRCRSCTRGMSEACRESFDVQRGSTRDWPYTRGAFCDYLYLHPGQAVFKVPDNVSDTMVVSANCALAQVVMGLERVDVRLGDNVVVQGCGGLGVYACAIAKERGAESVIAIDGIDERLELARRMGADHLIDFREVADSRERVTAVKDFTAGLGADVVVEVVGSAAVINEGLRMLAWGGRYLEMGTFYTGTSFECDPGRLVGQNQRIEAVASYDAASLQRSIEFLSRNAERLPLDEVVVDYALEDIEKAFADQDSGLVRRASLVMNPTS
jgi:threonine dehydrogenase-like Zn-dependent dehydrogenase